MNLTNSQDDEIMNQIRSLALVDDQELIVVGDFNLPDVCWNSGRVNSPKDTINQKLLLQKAYLDLFHETNMKWCLNNSHITRRRLLENGVLQESCLDQVLVPNPALILDFKIISAVGKSDHLGILSNIKVKNDIGYVRSLRPNWAKFDSSTIRLSLIHI